jgi:hypothetical protein
MIAHTAHCNNNESRDDFSRSSRLIVGGSLLRISTTIYAPASTNMRLACCVFSARDGAVAADDEMYTYGGERP